MKSTVGAAELSEFVSGLMDDMGKSVLAGDFLPHSVFVFPQERTPVLAPFREAGWMTYENEGGKGPYGDMNICVILEPEDGEPRDAPQLFQMCRFAFPQNAHTLDSIEGTIKRRGGPPEVVMKSYALCMFSLQMLHGVHAHNVIDEFNRRLARELEAVAVLTMATARLKVSTDLVTDYTPGSLKTDADAFDGLVCVVQTRQDMEVLHAPLVRADGKLTNVGKVERSSGPALMFTGAAPVFPDAPYAKGPATA